MSIMVRHVPRERDELVLQWLAWRAAGHGAKSIATRFGVSDYSVVRKATSGVMNDDMSFGPEAWGDTIDEIERAYW